MKNTNELANNKEMMSAKKNDAKMLLRENLLKKDKTKEVRFDYDISINDHSDKLSEKSMKKNLTQTNVKVASKFIEEELEEKDKKKQQEKKAKKVEFNQTVEEMAKYYIDSDSTIFYFSQFLQAFLVHLIYFFWVPSPYYF